MKAFCDSLEGVCYFWSLMLSGNGIHSTGVSYLADAVCSRNIVTEKTIITKGINLSDNPLGLEGCVAVCRMLSSSHCQARRVDLSRCKLTTVGGGLPSADPVNLCDDIPHQTLREVEQQPCQIPRNNTILSLDLNGISFTEEGIHILAGFMHLCVRLEFLKSSDCEITSDDLKLLLDKLSQLKSSSSKLETWNLNNNRIDDRGVSALIDHLPSLFPRLGCGSAGRVYLNHNPVSSQAQRRLDEELESRRKVSCRVEML